MKLNWMMIILAGAMTTQTGCSSLRSIFVLDKPEQKGKPISDPFGYEGSNSHGSGDRAMGGGGMIYRSKKGDRSIEIEMPSQPSTVSDFVIPVSPQFRDAGRNPASEGGIDETYREKKPNMADREITGSFPQTAQEDQAKQKEVELALGVAPSEESHPDGDRSYLAAMDHVKQLYKIGRYEAALIDVIHGRKVAAVIVGMIVFGRSNAQRKLNFLLFGLIFLRGLRKTSRDFTISHIWLLFTIRLVHAAVSGSGASATVRRTPFACSL